MRNQCLVCGRGISAKFFMCLGHWSLVPKALQDAMERTHAAYIKPILFHESANRESHKRWQLVRGAAIVAVRNALGEIPDSELNKATEVLDGGA